MHCSRLIAAAFGLAATTGASLAQDLSDEEILKRFMIQRDAYTAVRTGKGATRGLTLVTVEDLGGDAVAEDGTAPVVADTGPALDPNAGGTDTTPEVTEATDTTPDPGQGAGDLVTVAADSTPAVDPTEVGLLPEELQVNVRISFDYDSATIKADQQPVLDQMCRVMQASDIQLFRIMGHTDSAGSDDYNEGLSRLRAEEVKRRLVDDCGIDPNRLDAMGLGERFPADKADPAAAENRRVEFQALS